MFEKSRAFIIVGAIALLMGGLFFLGYFALSDFMNWEILATKPWRPLARAIFSVVMATVLIFFCGLIVKIAMRHDD